MNEDERPIGGMKFDDDRPLGGNKVISSEFDEKPLGGGNKGGYNLDDIDMTDAFGGPSQPVVNKPIRKPPARF